MSLEISVVIASVNGPSCILECLGHLEALPERNRMEIIVLDRREDNTAALIAERFPRVTVVAGLTGQSIPQLRWRGMRQSRGTMIAVIEDHCMVTPNWAAEILRFSDSPYGAVGGPVENGACLRTLDWAFFLAEYGACMPPLPEGETEWVPGNNVAYRRAVLPLDEPEWATVWESFLQQELRRRGVRMYLDPAMLVHHKKSFGLGELLEQRFFYSRSFAGMRARAMTGGHRLLYSAVSLLLPGLLLLRITRGLLQRRRNLPEFVRGFPVIGIFVAFWGLGEMAGYLFGPGNSLARVE